MASAETVEIGGVYYTLDENDKTAVVAANPNGYEGTIAIPATVTDVSGDYSVTSIAAWASIEPFYNQLNIKYIAISVYIY